MNRLFERNEKFLYLKKKLLQEVKITSFRGRKNLGKKISFPFKTKILKEFVFAESVLTFKMKISPPVKKLLFVEKTYPYFILYIILKKIKTSNVGDLFALGILIFLIFLSHETFYK